MYAVVEIAGQQFKLVKDQKAYVHRLTGEKGSKVVFDNVLLLDNEGLMTTGTPVVEGASVTAKILNHLKGDKVIIFKKKRRKGYKKKNGHRQFLSQIQVESIKTDKTPATKKPKVKAETKADNVEKVKVKTPAAKKPKVKAETKTDNVEKVKVKTPTAKKPKVKAEAETDNVEKVKVKTPATKKPKVKAEAKTDNVEKVKVKTPAAKKPKVKAETKTDKVKKSENKVVKAKTPVIKKPETKETKET